MSGFVFYNILWHKAKVKSIKRLFMEYLFLLFFLLLITLYFSIFNASLFLIGILLIQTQFTLLSKA